jgi:glutamyl-tRNA reductase
MMAEITEIDAAALLLVGINHRSAGLPLRDQLFAEEPDLAPLLEGLGALDVEEALAMATCERLELLVVRRPGQAMVEPLLALLAVPAEQPVAAIASESICLEGEAALRHLFAVAASLESQVLGEPQVLGQIKECHRRAAEAGLVGPFIESVLQAAYATAKRVRHETPLAEQTVSMASSALQVARGIHGALERCVALVIGLGDMGELFASHLKSAGVGELVISHGSLVRAEDAARRLACHVRAWEELEEALAGADIVVSDRGSGRWTVTRDMADSALRKRRRRPIFFIDAAVPGDVESSVGELDDAFLYDLDDLERVASAGRTTREVASVMAWEILEQDLADFLRQRAERAAVPLVSTLRRHFEEARRGVVADPRLDADSATRLLIKRLLHDPSEVLRSAAAEDSREVEQLEESLRRLFRLDRPTGGFEDEEEP